MEPLINDGPPRTQNWRRKVAACLRTYRERPMSRTARDFKLHSDPYKALMRRASIAALAGIAAVLAAGAFALAQAPAQEQGADKSKIPQLASAQFAWLALGVTWFDPPPGLGHGPIRADPAHPYVGNRDRGQVTLHIGDSKDPVLKPWAA